ncbi:MAG: flagellar biosynthesis anti-sigma factor FlgM [Gammaproteobacteria bacterium]
MPIQPINSGNVPNSVPTKTTTKSAADRTAPEANSIAGEDTVSFTNGITKNSTLDSSTPAVDDSRIARIKTALASGEYQVDSKLAASKIMEFEKTFKNTT